MSDEDDISSLPGHSFELPSEVSPRKLKAKWSTQSVADFYNDFAVTELEGVKFQFVPPIKWWQFWRWRVAWSEDYILSRAGEIVLIHKLRAEYARLTAEQQKWVDENRRDQAQ